MVNADRPGGCGGRTVAAVLSIPEAFPASRELHRSHSIGWNVAVIARMLRSGTRVRFRTFARRNGSANPSFRSPCCAAPGPRRGSARASTKYDVAANAPANAQAGRNLRAHGGPRLSIFALLSRSSGQTRPARSDRGSDLGCDSKQDAPRC